MNEIIIDEILFDRVMALHMEFAQLINNPRRIVRVIRNLLVEVDNIDEETIELHLKTYYEIFPYEGINNELINSVISNNILSNNINISIDNNIDDNIDESINEELSGQDNDYNLDEMSDDYNLDESSDDDINHINSPSMPIINNPELFNQEFGSSILNSILSFNNQNIAISNSQELINVINTIPNQTIINNNTMMEISILDKRSNISLLIILSSFFVLISLDNTKFVNISVTCIIIFLSLQNCFIFSYFVIKQFSLIFSILLSKFIILFKIYLYDFK